MAQPVVCPRSIDGQAGGGLDPRMTKDRRDPGKTARGAVLFFIAALLLAGGVLVYRGGLGGLLMDSPGNPAGKTFQDIVAGLPWGSQKGVERPAGGTDRRAASARDQLYIVTSSGRHEIKLEIADTEEKKRLGLMFRTELADGHGMLFPYDSPQEITMWMKNTYISLDMIFIGADGTVVRVARNTEPMSEEIVSSQRPALGVLELKAGAADKYGIIAGKSRVEHPYFEAAEPR